MKILVWLLFLILGKSLSGQVVTDTIPVTHVDSSFRNVDSTLRIINLTPYFTQHVDSSLVYQFQINRDASNYYWFLKNAPVGLKINKDNGLLSFKADKSYFLSGKLKYDQPYRVNIGVQSLSNPTEKVDTTFVLQFYNTEIIPSRVKPTVGSVLTIEEGELLSFKVLCENGNFPIDNILFTSNLTIQNYTLVKKCDDEFKWTPDYDFVRENDSGRVKIVLLSFIGNTRYQLKDTATVRLIVKDALNYPLANLEYNQVRKNVENYILQLKYSFLQIDRKLKKIKTTRTSFDLTTGATSLTGTILNSSSSDNSQKAGKILSGVGISLVPVKEAVAPNKNVEQNQAALIRASIKRLEYMLGDNMIVGEKDPDVVKKMNKLKEELKQIQIQLIDIPLELTSGMTPEELNQYFNSTKVNKKYRLKR
jgi:hypothetical protein